MSLLGLSFLNTEQLVAHVLKALASIISVWIFNVTLLLNITEIFCVGYTHGMFRHFNVRSDASGLCPLPPAPIDRPSSNLLASQTTEDEITGRRKRRRRPVDGHDTTRNWALCDHHSSRIRSSNHLRTKFNPLYLKNQSVPRSKHLSPQL
jgi:hypothetical protein